MITVKGKLLAKEEDLMGYTTYVFQNLDEPCPFGHKYCMMVKLPNWNQGEIDIGDVGFVSYDEVNAGDTWYNPDTGEKVPYKYTNVYFIKFVKEIDNSKKDIII